MQFQTSIIGNLINEKITDNTTEIIECSQNQLIDFQPRDDYKELLGLAIIFLGVPERGVNLRSLSELHRA